MGEPTVRTERASLREDSLHDQTTSNGIRSAPTARGGEAAYSQDTDEIIEELKALAENMLETSRNARRRASLAGKQNQRSYEALMNALNPATGAKSQPSVPSVSTPAVVASPDSPGLTSATTDAVAQPAEHRHHDPVELHPASRKSTSHPKTMSSSGSEGEDEDDAETVYDGVKTVVYFQAADPAAFEVVASSRWQPEPLRRASNGTCIPVDPEESSEADNGQAGTGAHQKGGRVVDRVPLYPFGGGVTEAQSRLLSTAFERAKQAMKAGNGTSSDSSSSSRIPIEISQTAFASRAHSDVEASASLREANFQPRSCFDFVVDIERGIIFNAAEARHARRQEFRRLVKEGRAPSTMMGTFNLRVIMDPFKTGFEEESAFPIVAGTVIADRYEIVNLLGKATFSRAVRCYDLCDPIYADEGEADEECGGELNSNGEGHGKTTKKRRKIRGYGQVCLKIITNRKDFFDQSLDEIRLLTLINHFSDPDDVHVIRLIDAFYYKEHTMLVTELLSDNLYEYSKYNREEEAEPYFTLPRLRRIARQVTEALAYVHSLNLIHADLKPENILFVSHRQCTVKVIDFGSSCFLSDHLSSYIQSRSYRAPEVILGCDYDGRIDVWSLGAILAELVTGDVLFSAETVPEMLARIVYVSGVPIPRRVLWEGRRTHEFVNKFGCIYEGVGPREGATQRDDDAAAAEEEEPQTYYVYHPLPHYRPRGGEEESSQGGRSPGRVAPASPASDEAGTPENGPYRVLRAKLAAAGMTDPDFLSFLQDCLCLDHKLRSTTKQLLEHPFIANERL